MSSKEKLVKEAFELPTKLGEIPFSVVVKVSSGYDVLPIDMANTEDKELIETIKKLLAEYMKVSLSSHPAFKGKRINDVGRQIEPQIRHELNRAPFEVELLGKAGYPDMKLTYKGKVTYLEMKTTSTISQSRLRTFYYTGGKKLTTTAHHLLLLILASPAGTDYWKIDSLTLSDLSGLSVKLKPEFNANKTDLMNVSARLFSVK
ncbi:MAG: hypothetical protein AUJ08_04695 [Thaumarchaeota archaeon 13_1_40CM_3_50_5]|nr:MAG: hypothetical protein AUJ08_04695 [Thaumarchaeota archaeon 13_1_40CM_3_50_5]